MSMFALPPPTTMPHQAQPDAYLPAPLLPNPSTDSSSSSDSDISVTQLITPRGSMSAASCDPIHIRLPSDSSSTAYPHDDMRGAATNGGLVAKKSSRNLRSKASFSSWRSSFSASSVSLRLRPSQDSQDGTEDVTTRYEEGQFDDANPSPARSMSSRKAYLASSPMTPAPTGSSEGSSSDSLRDRGSTRKLMSGLKRLGYTLRPTSAGRRAALRTQSSLDEVPVEEAPQLQVAYAPTPVAGPDEPRSSLSAFRPPARHEHLGDTNADHVRAEDEGEVHTGAKPTHQEDEMGRGLFSPGPPGSPVVRAIQGSLSPISDFTLSSTSSPVTALGSRTTHTRPSYPTPVLPSTACPSPSPGSHPTRAHLPRLSLVCDGLPTSTSRPSSTSPESPLPRPESSTSVRASISHSASTHSVKSLNRLSTLSVGSSTARSPSSQYRSSGFRSGSATPTGLTCTPIHPPTRSGLPSSQSAQSLSLSSGASGIRRASSLRSADRASRASTPTGSPSTSISASYTIQRRHSPIPPSLILTPKALVPPVHAVSPLIGACPVERNPVPDAPGRPRTKSGRWRSPTGLFELGGLGLGDLSGAREVVRASKGEARGDRGKYEHVDTPGEFGLGAEKEKKVQEEGGNPYFG